MLERKKEKLKEHAKNHFKCFVLFTIVIFVVILFSSLLPYLFGAVTFIWGCIFLFDAYRILMDSNSGGSDNKSTKVEFEILTEKSE